jgi:hypothetical protein
MLKEGVALRMALLKEEFLRVRPPEPLLLAVVLETLAKRRTP